MSIASCEALDTRSNERCVRRFGFASEDEAFVPTSAEVEGTSLASVLSWLLPELAGATGVAKFGDGKAALAAPTIGAAATAGGSLRAGRAGGGSRCDVAP